MADQGANQQPTAGQPSPAPSELDRVPVKSSSAEDPDTAAARKELRNTAISERPNMSFDAATGRANTPDPTDKMKDQISSPKKKRAHDEVDQNKEHPHDANGDVSPLGADAAVSRTNRSEPEKKRPRDVSSETKPEADAVKPAVRLPPSFPSSMPLPSVTIKADRAQGSDKSDTDAKAVADKPKATSNAAFSSSGLSGFATQASPFLQAAGSQTLTSFASPSGSVSPFGGMLGSKPETTTASVFGGGGQTNGSSVFGQVGSASKPFGGSAFGSGLGGGLTGLASGAKLTSFGTPGESFKGGKPAKPFGAPESDAESDEEDGGDGDEKAGDDDKQDKDEKEGDDDRKKVKLQKTNVDDGEAGEATILQVRSRIYFLDKSSEPAAWKERGAGNLKLNVPEACVDLDDNGTPIPGSFDASALEDADNKTVRLIMRQDATHRLLLNSIVVPAMVFSEKPTNKTICVLFTAIEDKGEPVSIQLKMNPGNAKNFLNEIGKIQRELQSN